MFKLIRRLVAIIILVFIGFRVYRIHQDVQKVLTYESMVETTLASNDTDANVDMVLAMIYTETKGSSSDVMQSSESSNGVANSISDSQSSIQQGVSLLSENLAQATEAKIDKWTAVQAYNFGTAYIDFIAKHGGDNTVELAESYSRDVVAPSLGNTTGQTYFYYHPIALFYGGGKLYVNGGNIYYSREVQFNLYLIKLMRLF
ncbi:lysozyme family protein [Streptococcus loxodontisalivarius]|uniref:Soluble lytic murein transglycosylase-like protein n=1 Tax=Streptococcus loxodontisalivarius TaxID=1349415 RepID=A0ABS2PPQ3_9STRE|nr:lysozyme family protein [Streptococcus loxodontisalivarius]MBM7642014.1 soluble lytic murein transglycosylase-like protein [Streptococcus loxodontisalivarius]